MWWLLSLLVPTECAICYWARCAGVSLITLGAVEYGLGAYLLALAAFVLFLTTFLKLCLIIDDRLKDE